MTTALGLQIPQPIGSLEAYIGAVNLVPMLTLEEEQALANQFRESGDLDAARRLVMSHLRFVVRVARGYSGYGLAQGDLIQEGNIGLMKAVKRFDPTVGVRLVSFAVHWVRAEMHEFILRNWRIVKVATTKSQRKLFFNLRSSKKRLGWMNLEEVNAIASDLNVDPKEVLLMEERLSARDASISIQLTTMNTLPLSRILPIRDSSRLNNWRRWKPVLTRKINYSRRLVNSMNVAGT